MKSQVIVIGVTEGRPIVRNNPLIASHGSRRTLDGPQAGFRTATGASTTRWFLQPDREATSSGAGFGYRATRLSKRMR